MEENTISGNNSGRLS